MRLINVKAFLDFDLEEISPDVQILADINGERLSETAYAILSHCWGEPKDEIQFTEMESLTKMDVATRDKIRDRRGYFKIRQSCLQAHCDRLSWLWVDTCCIDKRSSTELSEAINSMYAWYANSDRCYAFLHDLDSTTFPTEPDNTNFEFNGWPKWFSRGWTLQELIAPEEVHFYNRNWEYVTSKQQSARTLSIITRISHVVLQKGLSSVYPSVAQIMSWAAERKTTREEDRAYSLLGLLGVHMPMLYGEGKNAFLRLQLEVIRMTDDQSILAWGWRSNTESANGFLANDPSSFRDCSHVVRVTTRDILDTLEQYFSKDQLRRLISAEEHSRTFAVTNRGIQIWLPLKFEGRDGHSEYFSALLACREVRGDRATPITIPIMQFGRSLSRHFGRPPAVGNQRASIECKSILLPFRDNVTPNIRGLSRKLRRSHISLEDILSSDSVILVLGTSRSGKSNFINKLTTTPPKAFPDRLPVRTKIASAYVTVCQGKRFAFVDTPPLDRDGFETISRQLGFLYRRPVKFAGVIYTFNLNSRWVGEEVRNLQTVLNMCGEEAIDRLRVVLTIWDGVDSEYCTKVQAELDNLLAKIPKAGACCQKFDNTAASAWAIVEGLGDEKKVLSLQRAMVDDRIDLPQTSAREWISELLCM